MERLTNKVTIVTGAALGLGAAMEIVSERYKPPVSRALRDGLTPPYLIHCNQITR